MIKYYKWIAHSGNEYHIKLKGDMALDGYIYKVVDDEVAMSKDDIIEDEWEFTVGKYLKISKTEFLISKI